MRKRKDTHIDPDPDLVEERELDYAGVIAALAELCGREVYVMVGDVETRGVLQFNFDNAALPQPQGPTLDLTQGDERHDVIVFDIGESADLMVPRRRFRNGWLRRERVPGTVDPDYVWLTVGAVRDDVAWIVHEDWRTAWPRRSED